MRNQRPENDERQTDRTTKKKERWAGEVSCRERSCESAGRSHATQRAHGRSSTSGRVGEDLARSLAVIDPRSRKRLQRDRRWPRAKRESPHTHTTLRRPLARPATLLVGACVHQTSSTQDAFDQHRLRGHRHEVGGKRRCCSCGRGNGRQRAVDERMGRPRSACLPLSTTCASAAAATRPRGPANIDTERDKGAKKRYKTI